MAHTQSNEDFAPVQNSSLLCFYDGSRQDQNILVPSTTSQRSGSIPSAFHEAGWAPIAGTQSFKSVTLFDTELTPPQFQVSYRWWEEEALPILWAFNIGDIKRILQFRLYDDDEFPRKVLQHRNTATLTEFVCSLLPAGRADLVDLAHHEKVDEVISLCQPNNIQSPWNWFPSYFNDVHPATIALQINVESVFQFKAVPFEDWVRYAIGYPTMSVVWLLEQHRELYNIVCAHLDRHPEVEYIYVEVEKHLRPCCPLAHCSVLQCLKDRGIANLDEKPDQHVANFLIEPIQALFKSPSRPFAKFLKKLSVLSIRFAREYHEAVEIDWTSPFEAGPPHLDELVELSPATTLARQLTYFDERKFAGFSVQNFEEDDAKLQVLVNNWHLLSISVADCCMALPEIPHYFKDCVKTLFNLRNYYSATAMLHGVQQAQDTPYILDPFSTNDPSIDPCFSLLDSTNNYATYRKFMEETPGLPFLHPHITEYYAQGQKAIAGLFPLSAL
ncbi:hypothetical protein PRK78_002958 [Emydomyces testavorans]|uniref:Ras-GEF domain-containing protein n=1 Tax=Emydomyces testavorans TaxID=2070801 RepID=A0AAF0IIB4_9EURO|nr:hypothetical protein PRK78_002958 [Emydomyces testavorans]